MLLVIIEMRWIFLMCIIIGCILIRVALVHSTSLFIVLVINLSLWRVVLSTIMLTVHFRVVVFY